MIGLTRVLHKLLASQLWAGTKPTVIVCVHRDSFRGVALEGAWRVGWPHEIQQLLEPVLLLSLERSWQRWAVLFRVCRGHDPRVVLEVSGVQGEQEGRQDSSLWGSNITDHSPASRRGPADAPRCCAPEGFFPFLGASPDPMRGPETGMSYVYRLQSPLRQICNLWYWAI